MRRFGASSVILGLLIASIAVNAAYLSISAPTTATLYNNGSVYLGKVAPGESFYVSASAATTGNNGASINIGWDTLTSVNLPQGWSAQPSQLYANPMRMKVRVSPYAPSGTYRLLLRAVNLQNYSGIGNLTFAAYVNVTSDVLNLDVTPTNISAGLGEPVNIYVSINNTGISDDPFYIAAYGLPAWNESERVISLHGTKNTFVYPVMVNEPALYTFNLTVNSTTSQLLRKTYTIRMLAKAGLINDYTAFGQGALLSPIIYEPAYALMQLLGYIYKSIAH